MLSQRDSSHIRCGYWQWQVLWRRPDLTADSLLRRSKWTWNVFGSSGYEASHMMEALLLLRPVMFCICGHMSLGVAGVEVPLASSMPAFSLRRCSCFLVAWPNVSFFLALNKSPAPSFIQAFRLGNDFIVFVITTSSTHLLTDYPVGIYCSRLMWFSWGGSMGARRQEKQGNVMKFEGATGCRICIPHPGW